MESLAGDLTFSCFTLVRTHTQSRWSGMRGSKP